MSVPYNNLFHVLTYSTVQRDALEGNEARLLRRLHDAILALGYTVDVVPSLEGAKVAAKSDMSIGCFLLAIDGPDAPDVQNLI